jgi:hypothetical protein
VRGSGAGTVENVKPAGLYRVFVRFALVDDVPEPLAVYPPAGVVTDSTQLQGSALDFTVVKTLCAAPASQTPNGDGDQCVCKQGFFDADPTDGELSCEPCAVGSFRDDITAATCTPCAASTSTQGAGSTSRASCVCDVGYFTDAALGGQCVSCGSGSFSATKAAAACAPCPAGTRSNPGASSLAECTLCPMLTVASHPGMAECQRCGASSPVGSVSSTDDGTDCQVRAPTYVRIAERRSKF